MMRRSEICGVCDFAVDIDYCPFLIGLKRTGVRMLPAIVAEGRRLWFLRLLGADRQGGFGRCGALL